MLHLIMNLSSINAINGINLTRDQAVRLRALAWKVEAASPAAPDLRAAFRPDLGEVRDTYLELRDTLLAGREADDALAKRVMLARGLEAAVIRLAGAAAQPDGAGCTRCHGPPAEPDVRGLAQTKAALDTPLPPRPTPHEAFIAHNKGLAGDGGMLALALLAPQVEEALTPEQRIGLASFACCLVPPKSLSNPVRIGQATDGEKEIESLRWARGVPAARWPAMKAVALEMWRTSLAMKAPGLPDAQRQDACRHIGAVYEQARALPAADFEADKGRLARAIQEVVTPTRDAPDRERRFMTAVFLIGPGTAEAYDRLLSRLDAAAKPPA
jgi:hypothetical protein